MKKIFIALVLSTCISYSFAQHAEDVAPQQENNTTPAIKTNSNNKALWDVQLSFNATSAAAGDVGMAAIAFFNNEFWVSRWVSDTVYRFSSTGVLISEFTISGLSGTRSFTTDGTYLYAGTASTTIYRIDPSLQQLAPPHITSSSSVTARFCTYDPTLNSGNGGFWIGNFSTDIVAISMSGAVLSTIPAATHGFSGMYGAAIDNETVGGPYLWVFDQGGSNDVQLTALNLPAGTPSSTYNHDVFPDVSTTHSLTSAIAGGAFFTKNFVSGKSSIMCLLQGTPNNVVVVYEIGTTVGINELAESEGFTVYPNPTNNYIHLDLTNLSENFNELTLTDVSGKIVLNQSIVINNTPLSLDVNNLPNGIYTISIISNKQVLHKKITISK